MAVIYESSPSQRRRRPRTATPISRPTAPRSYLKRDLRNGKDAQVVIIGADGKNEQVLDFGCVDPCADDVAPTWSPGGDRINFTRVVGPFDLVPDSARSAILWSALSDGTDIQRFSEPGIDGVYEDYFARYSPDGSYIVFTRVRNDPLTRRHSAWTSTAPTSPADPVGHRRRPRRPLTGDERPDHGPGRVRDLRHGAPEGKSQNLATVPTTCASPSACKTKITYLTHLKHGPRARFNPSWSPNGSGSPTPSSGTTRTSAASATSTRCAPTAATAGRYRSRRSSSTGRTGGRCLSPRAPRVRASAAV